MGGGPAPGSCAFGVKRDGQGHGLVEVTSPNGRKRAIYFEKGSATGYDADQSDRSAFRASRKCLQLSRLSDGLAETRLRSM